MTIKVKPLVWQPFWAQDKDRREYAKPAVGPVYHVSDAGWWFALCPITKCNGREAAKAAAQAHHDAAIRSQIEEASPVTIRAEALLARCKALVKAHDKENWMRSADYHGDECSCFRCHMDAMRALIDKEPGQ